MEKKFKNKTESRPNKQKYWKVGLITFGLLVAFGLSGCFSSNQANQVDVPRPTPTIEVQVIDEINSINFIQYDINGIVIAVETEPLQIYKSANGTILDADKPTLPCGPDAPTPPGVINIRAEICVNIERMYNDFGITPTKEMITSMAEKVLRLDQAEIDKFCRPGDAACSNQEAEVILTGDISETILSHEFTHLEFNRVQAKYYDTFNNVCYINTGDSSIMMTIESDSSSTGSINLVQNPEFMPTLVEFMIMIKNNIPGVPGYLLVGEPDPIMVDAFKKIATEMINNPFANVAKAIFSNERVEFTELMPYYQSLFGSDLTQYYSLLNQTFSKNLTEGLQYQNNSIAESQYTPLENCKDY